MAHIVVCVCACVSASGVSESANRESGQKSEKIINLNFTKGPYLPSMSWNKETNAARMNKFNKVKFTKRNLSATLDRKQIRMGRQAEQSRWSGEVPMAVCVVWVEVETSICPCPNISCQVHSLRFADSEADDSCYLRHSSPSQDKASLSANDPMTRYPGGLGNQYRPDDRQCCSTMQLGTNVDSGTASNN
jgi:hypothetical protein